MLELVVPGITEPNTLLVLACSRTYVLYCKAVQNALAGKCAFCELDPELNKVIVENDRWHAWQSPAPEKNTAHHFIIVPKRHVIDNSKLSLLEEADLFMIFFKLKSMFKIKSCGLLCRDGDATLSAGTIQHLHWHLMVPNGEGRVETPFYKGKKDDEAGVARAIVFEKMRQGLEINGEEKALVADRLK